MSRFSFAMPRASRLAMALALACVIPSTAFATDDLDPQSRPAKDLDKVVVRGKADGAGTVDSIEQARERLAERAGATALVDAESYRSGRASTLTDALGFAPGVFIQSRFGAEEARLSIRGSGLQRTFHGRGLALLQDGSPLNLADGGFDFQAVEPLSARYIEVYRGANALEYGAASLGGAINFVAPTGYDAPAFDVRMEAGSFGYRREQVAVAGNKGRVDGYLSLTGFKQDGYRDHSMQENYRLFANAGVRFSDTLEGRLYLTHVDTNSELPGNLTLGQANADPRAANPGSLLQDQRRDFRLDRLAGKLAWAPAPGQAVTVSVYYADKSLFHPIFQVLEQDTRDAGIDLRWRSEGVLAGHRNLLTAGASFARGDTDDNRFVNVAGAAGTRTNAFDQRASNATVYVDNQTWLDARWVLALGAQALRSTRVSHDLFITGNRDESYDVRYTGVSPKVGMRYLIDERTQVFANISRSLEPPSFGELSGGPNVTQVDMQRATTAELGIRMQRDVLSLDAAVYRARLQDELLSLTDDNGTPLGTVNAARTRHQGLELGLGWQLAPAWLLSANYLWNDFTLDNDPIYGNNALAGIPPQQLRANVRWSNGDAVYLAPNLEWAPRGYYVDHANSFRVPGYALVGMRIGGKVDAQWSWFVDARNLADRRWISSTTVVANALGQDQANVLPGDRRSVYVGLEWKL